MDGPFRFYTLILFICENVKRKIVYVVKFQDLLSIITV